MSQIRDPNKDFQKRAPQSSRGALFDGSTGHE